MQREKIKVEERKVVGKKVKSLRKTGILPVNIYGKDIKSISSQVPLKDFEKLYKKVHETGLVDVELNGKILPALFHNVQFDPRSQKVIHADLYKVDLKEKIKASVPVVSVGDAPAVLDKKGLLLQLLSEIEVEALPTDLPEKIEVGLENLKELNEEIAVSAIKSPDGVSIINNPSQIVFKIGALVTRETEEQAKAEEAAAAEAKTTEAGTEVPVAQSAQPQAEAPTATAQTQKKEEQK